MYAMGNALSIGLRQGLIDAGVPVEYGTELTDLVVEDGRVVGVKVLRDGVERTVRATRGVILGSGGFEKNLELRERYQPKPTSIDWTTGRRVQHRRWPSRRDGRRRGRRADGRRLVGSDDPAPPRPVVRARRAQPARLDHRQLRRASGS